MTLQHCMSCQRIIRINKTGKAKDLIAIFYDLIITNFYHKNESNHYNYQYKRIVNPEASLMLLNQIILFNGNFKNKGWLLPNEKMFSDYLPKNKFNSLKKYPEYNSGFCLSFINFSLLDSITQSSSMP